MRVDFGFLRDQARREQRRKLAGYRLANIRRMRFSRRMAIFAVSLAIAVFPGRLLVAWAWPS